MLASSSVQATGSHGGTGTYTDVVDLHDGSDLL